MQALDVKHAGVSRHCRTVDVSSARNGYGYSWLVTFVTNLGPQNAIVAVGSELSGPAASVATSCTRTGVLPAGYGSKSNN